MKCSLNWFTCVRAGDCTFIRIDDAYRPLNAWLIMCITLLHVGGLVAVGFDPTARYLLTVSHSGRGVFDTVSWNRVARDVSIAYPENGVVEGIGPIAGQRIKVRELY